MKRTLSLVLALVMLLGTIPAFAADTAAEQAAFLEEMGVLKGNTAGDLMLAAELKREDSVVMLARLLGLEAAAEAWEGAPTWTDLPENPYYVSFLAWAQEAGYYQGHSNLRFGFGETISANDFALVLLRALGYAEVGDDSWETAFEDATELGLLEGLTVDKTGKLLRGDMAVMVYLALGTEMAEGGKTLAEELGVEMPVVAVEVMATGRKELTVKFNKAVEGATFKVTRDGIAVNLDTQEMSADKMSAVLTTTAVMLAGNYTVAVTGVAEEVLEATVAVVAEKATEIKLASNKAPLTDTDYDEANLDFSVLNQYGEKMNNVTVNWTMSTGKTQAVTTHATTGVGTINIAYAVAGTKFTPGTLVYLTGVQTDAALVLNTQVEIVLPSHVDAIEFLGVVKKDGKEVVALKSGFASEEYVLAFTAKDQYGNKMTVGTTGTSFNDLVFTSNNPMFVKGEFSVGNPVTVDNVVYQTVKLEPGTNPAAGGAVTIQAISSRTGKVSAYTLNADALGQLNTFTLSAPTVLVAAGDGTVEIPYVAVDQYGNTITKLSALDATKVTLTPSVGSLTWSEKDGVAVLTYNVPATAAVNTPVYLTSVVLAGGNYSTVNFTVRPTKVATTVVGLASTVNTQVAQGDKIEITGANVIVHDQYGREIKSHGLVLGTDILATFVGEGFTDSGTTTITLLADGTGTTTSVTFTLKDKPASARTVTFTKILQTEFVSYEVKDLGVMYGGAVSANHDKTVVVYGVLSNGTKVELPASYLDVKVVYTTTGAITTSGTAISVVDASKLTFDATTKEAKATVVVTVEDQKVSGAVAQILEKDLVLSSVAPKATTITLKDTVVNGSANITVTSTSAITASDIVGFVKSVKDQYGVDYPTAPSIVITNVTTATRTGGEASFVVLNNAETNASITGWKAGDKFTATIKYGTGASTAINFTVK